MARPFRAGRRGITGHLEQPERELLIKLFGDVVTTLEPRQDPDQDPLAAMLGITEDAEAPEDPALARLLPQAAADDRRGRGLRQQ
ncbi:DUF2017 family protein, partial [Rothia kristinae]|uniref:DUF2017 family protein n=1 Tax=Rothia kristinae TaxID=37923 RepID=UPI0007944DB9